MRSADKASRDFFTKNVMNNLNVSSAIVKGGVDCDENVDLIIAIDW